MDAVVQIFSQPPTTAAAQASAAVANSSEKKTNNKQLQWLYQVPGDELLVNQRRVEEEIALYD